MPVVLLAVYCILIVLASMAGGLLPFWLRLTHRRMQVALSFVSGVMLGVALLHLLPHAWREWQEARGPAASLEPVALWVLVGFLILFLLERFFTFHQHEVGLDEKGHVLRAGEVLEESETHNASETCRAPHSASHGAHHHHHHNAGSGGGMSWGGALLGLAVHSVLNGVALAASVTAASHAEGGALGLAGLATFLVIFLHKPFDALTIGTLMAAAYQRSGRRHLVNALFAMMVPAGAVLFEVGLELSHAAAHQFIAGALALSAGMFICIALSDLLPELHFHSHDRVKLTAALLAGLLLAWAISLAEGELHHHGEGAEDHEHRDAPAQLLDPPGGAARLTPHEAARSRSA